MQEATEQQASGQQTAQSSSQSGSQQQSGQQDGAQAAGSQQTSQAKTSEQAPARPAYVPENYWDAAAGKVKDTEFGKHLNDLAAFKAAADSKRLSAPQNPDEYKIEVTKNFKAPEGMEPKFDDKNPSFANLRKFAHAKGLSQDEFSEVLDIYAGHQAQSDQEFKAARDGEIAKLGAAGPARVDAVNNWLTAKLGADLGSELQKMLVTEKMVRGFEKLLQDSVSQGGAGFSQAHRENGTENGKIAGYDKMTFEQRRAAQDALAARGAGR